MITYQKTISFKLMSLVCAFVFGISCFGQSELLNLNKPFYKLGTLTKSTNLNSYNNKVISNIKKSIIIPDNIESNDELTISIQSLRFNERDTSSVEIKYAKPGDYIELHSVRKGEEFPSNTYFEIPDKTEVVITSKHGQQTTLEAGSKSSSVITENSENHCSWWGRLKHRILNPLVSYNTCGKSSRHTASARGTVFTVEVNDEDVLFIREHGKIALNERVQVNLNEDLIVNSDEKRKLFVTNESFLNSKITEKNFGSETNLETNLDSINDIESFFKDQLLRNKRILKNNGSNSKAGFKFIEQGKFDEGLDLYEKAIMNGEIDRHVFIESALILTEAYFIAGELKNRATWLDVALEFIKDEYENNEVQYKHFDSIGASEAASGLKNDYALSTEYYAWAYTVKLKLTGCLENPKQNPLEWRLKAKKIKGE